MRTIAAIIFPFAAGAACGLLPIERKRKIALSLIAAVIADVLGALAAFSGEEVRLISFAPGAELFFKIDGIGRVFLFAVLALYTCVAFYAAAYLEEDKDAGSFFAFYLCSLGAMVAVASAGNLITVYLSFEFATLTSMPMVLHERTKAAVAAARKYLFYSIGGALLGLVGVFFIYHFAGSSRDFAAGGILDPSLYSGNESLLLTAIFLAIVGFGTKAGMYPMHGWLPTAHPIAPAPASALLSGIIAKAGVIALVRLIFYSAGAEFIRGTWVQTAWMALAVVTIFMGSMMAFVEKDLKKRLAYSTVSQLSYILFGMSLLSLDGLKGAMLHFLAHFSAKGCLFLAAGTVILVFGIHEARGLKGLGAKLPVTFACFTLASLSLIGIPPFGGFVSKWHLALGGLAAEQKVLGIIGVAALMVSALLTAGYLLPVVIDAFFPEKETEKKSSGKRGAKAAAAAAGSGSESRQVKAKAAAAAANASDVASAEAQAGSAGLASRFPLRRRLLLAVPLVVLSAVTLLVGVFGGSIASYLAGVFSGVIA